MKDGNLIRDQIVDEMDRDDSDDSDEIIQTEIEH